MRPVAGDPVFVDHAQRAKSHKSRIVILIERKSVEDIEPAIIAALSFVSTPNADPVQLLVITTNYDQFR